MKKLIFLLISLITVNSFSNISSLLYEYIDLNYTKKKVVQTTSVTSPFDVIATATYVHESSDDTIISQLFYKGNNTWTARFTGIKTGSWKMTTSSSDPELNGKTETINVSENPGNNGFITTYGSKYLWSGTDVPFVPTFVMVGDKGGGGEIKLGSITEARVDDWVKTYIVEHGFRGVHILVLHQWLKIDAKKHTEHSSTEPDTASFKVLEMVIKKLHDAGGCVHFWAWGDESRKMTPVRLIGGKNGVVDQRLQRYIAARLGPLPGWTIGYGFDLDEWCSKSDLQTWHSYMHSHFGWPHLMGGRSDGPTNGTNHTKYTWTSLDYTGYEHELGDESVTFYNIMCAAIDKIPGKPTFSEDRHRVRNRSKDVEEFETRQIMWACALAGGVSGIFGYLRPDMKTPGPYPHKEYIRTFRTFWKDRFTKEIKRDNSLSNGYCVKDTVEKKYIYYKENANSITYTIPAAVGCNLKVVAVNTALDYIEIDLGIKGPGTHTYKASVTSDWAIAAEYVSQTKIDDVGKIEREEKVLEVYPNPFCGVVNLAVVSSASLTVGDKIGIKIYNRDGKLVKSFSKNIYRLLPNHILRWNVDNYPSGLYYVTISRGNRIYTTKITLVK